MALTVRAQRVPPRPDELSDIYIDESSQTRHRYLVIGGIIIRTLDVAAANAAIAAERVPELPYGEMEWGKVSAAKINPYGRVVKAFFDRVEFAGTDFHCVVVDTHRLDHGSYNQGNREIGFNNEIYQLASALAGKASPGFRLAKN